MDVNLCSVEENIISFKIIMSIINDNGIPSNNCDQWYIVFNTYELEEPFISKKFVCAHSSFCNIYHLAHLLYHDCEILVKLFKFYCDCCCLGFLI